MKFTVCVILLLSGLACGWFYLWRPVRARRSGAPGGNDERPWRRVGAAICVVLGIMFPLGAYLLDDHPPPKVYAAYWSVMIVLVLWLCVLAMRDLYHTRRTLLVRRRRSSAGGGDVGPYCDESEGLDS